MRAVRQLTVVLLATLLTGVLTGIPGLSRFLQTQCPRAWTTLPMGTQLQPPALCVDHLCFDMNQLLHKHCKVDCIEEGWKKLFRSLDDIFHVIQPVKSVVFAFDGPAPFAKLSAQRKKREQDGDRIHLTTGTEFMNSMEDAILFYVTQRIRRAIFRDVSFFISGARSAGEGEFKIMNWIKTHVENTSESAVIYGMDADLLLQSLALPINVSILQEPDRRCAMLLCHVPTMASSLLDGRPVTPANIQDLVLSLVLLGCDYLPRLRTVTARRLLASLPTDTCLLLPSCTSFQFLGLYKFLQCFSADELPVLSSINNGLQRRGLSMVWRHQLEREVGWTSSLHVVQGSTGVEVASFDGEGLCSNQRAGRRAVTLANLPALLEIARGVNLTEASIPLQSDALAPDEDVDVSEEVDWEDLEELVTSTRTGSAAEMGLRKRREVEGYLRGLLWVSHLFTTARCPDWAFAFVGAPVTPKQLVRCIEFLVAELVRDCPDLAEFQGMSTEHLLQLPAVQDHLARTITLPRSVCRPLTATAAGACLFPSSFNASAVPPRLAALWRHVNKHHFAAEDGATGTYAALVACLRAASSDVLPVQDDDAQWVAVADEGSVRSRYPGRYSSKRVWTRSLPPGFRSGRLPAGTGVFQAVKPT